MSYRIIETTDRKNLGTVLDNFSLHDVISLSGCDFRIEDVRIDGDRITLSNPNYIIVAVKEF